MTLEKEVIKEGGVPEGYDEVIVEFFQFQKEGDSIKGRLVTKQWITVRGSRCGKYTLIRDPDNMKVAFLGSVLLDELLQNVGVGNEIYVVFTHKTAATEDSFEMKNFKVFSKSRG